jgi:hypothetical protein
MRSIIRIPLYHVHSVNTLVVSLSTEVNQRFVRMESSKFDQATPCYPTPGNGHDFRMQIFGLNFMVQDINDLQNCIWNNESFLPNRPAQSLPLSSGLDDLSTIGKKMAVILGDGSPGLLHSNQLRSVVKDKLSEKQFIAIMNTLKAFKSEADPAKKIQLGHLISDAAFWAQWLIRGFLFEG